MTLFFEYYSAEDSIKTASTAFQYQFTEHFNAFIALAYTIEHAVIVRPGFNLEF